jgi:hypothetical protein
MTRPCRPAFLLVALVILVGQGFAQRSDSFVMVTSRLAGDGTRALLIHVTGPVSDPIDEIGVELVSDDAARSAVALLAPAGWSSSRDGRWLRIGGQAIAAPVRIRVHTFELKSVPRVRVRLRQKNRTVADQEVAVTTARDVVPAARTAGFVQMPAVISPGDTIEVEILDPSTTPVDGHWLVAGVTATPIGTNRIRARLPDELAPGLPVRVSYFDVWGQRLLDALTVDGLTVREPEAAPPAVPRITGCARYGLSGESLCVCGEFPESSRNALTIDGQPASTLSVSRHVIHLRLPASVAPGAHTIGGAASAGFVPDNTVTTRVVAMRASIDANALRRGQSTTLRLALDGAIEPLTLSVTNFTPGIIAIPGGNYQEVTTTGDVTRPVELPVHARAVGSFSVDAAFTTPPCPCAETRDDLPSAASRQDPPFVPRRVLATIATAAPPAMLATAQAVAAANGLAVVEVVPLAVANLGLATFEITDGVAVPAKAAALAADPNVTAAQPDFVYDTSSSSAPLSIAGRAGAAIDGQVGQRPDPGENLVADAQMQSGRAAPMIYGAAMIGADVVRTVARGNGVRIAVIDSGIDTGHPRLQQRVAEHADVTGTGWTPDVHGTLVAGVIAADDAADGAPGGIAPSATLVGIKACVAVSRTSAQARCWSSTLARGIDAAVERKVRVMNVSVGGPADRLLSRMVDAASAQGIAVVSAAGNDGPSGKPSYPAAFDSAIAVTAVDVAGRLYQRATHGAFIDLAAPGVDILSTGPGGRDQLFSGTSAATAYAAGAVALLLERGRLGTADLRSLLGSTARDLGDAGPDPQFGDGLLDVCRAISKTTGREISCR